MYHYIFSYSWKCWLSAQRTYFSEMPLLFGVVIIACWYVPFQLFSTPTFPQYVAKLQQLPQILADFQSLQLTWEWAGRRDSRLEDGKTNPGAPPPTTNVFMGKVVLEGLCPSDKPFCWSSPCPSLLRPDFTSQHKLRLGLLSSLNRHLNPSFVSRLLEMKQLLIFTRSEGQSSSRKKQV